MSKEIPRWVLHALEKVDIKTTEKSMRRGQYTLYSAYLI